MARSAVILARLLPAAEPERTDDRLLRAFTITRDHEAFAEIVRRHGPMVLAICRRVLGDPSDAEDAFQAAFLVLARKASRVRATKLAGWLYAVAVRTARGVRVMRDRRRKYETIAANGFRREVASSNQTAHSCHSLEDHDLAVVIDEEIARLPEHYRVALVLCELRGLSRKQAAAELGIPEGTLSSRLAGAKRKLSTALSARGLSAPAVLVPLLTPAEVSATLVRSAVSATRGVAGPLASLAASTVMKGMLFDQLKSVTLAGGILLTIVCGGWAMTGGLADPPGPAPAPAPSLQIADDHAAKLVEQLGAPEFRDREAAAKALREMGVKAEPALRAGLKSDDLEIRNRCTKVLNETRKDQLWATFTKIVGDDKAARDLFAHIVASPRAVDALKAALDDPTRADELYRNRTAELLRIAAGHAPVDADGKANVPTDPDVWAAKPPPLGDVAGWLFLGTLQTGTAHWREVTHEGWQNRLSSFVPFLPEDDYTSAKPIAAAYEGELCSPLKKLTAAWLAKRRENDMLRAGLTLAIRYDIADAVTAARIVLNESKPADIGPWNLASAAILIGLHGTKSDLPLLARHAADDRLYSTFLNLPPGTDLTFGAPPVKDGRDLFCHVRDAVAVAMCKLAGKSPADFGFPQFPATKQPNGKPMSLTSATKVGFKAKADREAAFEKANDWIDNQKNEPKKDEPKPDPVSVKLVEQLGAAEFTDREAAQKELRKRGMRAEAAIRAGLKSENPEIVKRCNELLDALRTDLLGGKASPVWVRFKAVAGDDADAWKLYLRTIGTRKRAEMLLSAVKDPENAAAAFVKECDEIGKIMDHSRTAGVALPPKPPGFPDGDVTPDDLAALLFLGSLVPITKDGEKGELSAVISHVLISGLNGETKTAFGKLFAAWAEPRPWAWHGAFDIALTERVTAMTPVARKALIVFTAKERTPLEKENALALRFLGWYGTTDDIPLLMKFADDKTVCGSMSSDGKKDGTVVQVRDLAVIAALTLHKQRLQDFGFGMHDIAPPWPANFLANHGFDSDTDREAAHKKAKEWLEKQVKKEEPPKDEPTAGLLQDLVDLDAMRAGLSTDFAAVEKRGEELLAKYPNAADRGRIYFTLTRVYSNTGIDRTWARVEKYGRLTLEHQKDPAVRGLIFCDLASVAEVAVKAGDPLAADPFPVRRKRSAEIILEGYRELLPLKLPDTVPELPVVEKLGDALMGADPIVAAQMLARHAAQMEDRRKAEFVREMVHRRNTYAAQLHYLYSRAPQSDAELRKIVEAAIKDEKAAAELLERVAKVR